MSILENNRTEFFTENIYFKSYEVAVSHCRKLIEEERGYGIRAVEIKKIYLSGEDAQNQAPEEIVAVYDGEAFVDCDVLVYEDSEWKQCSKA